MSGVNEEDAGFVVEAANGSFYQHYKRGLNEFLEFASQTAADAIASGKLQPRDLVEVRRGHGNLSRAIGDLFPLLAKRINEANPTFFDECTIESIWNALGAVFLIAQHSGITDSAKAHAYTLQGKVARVGKQIKDDDRQAREIKMIEGAPSFIAAKATGKKVKVAALVKDCGIPERTLRRRLKQINEAGSD